MQCANGIAVGGNDEVMELVIWLYSRHLALWVVPLLKVVKNRLSATCISPRLIYLPNPEVLRL